MLITVRMMLKNLTQAQVIPKGGAECLSPESSGPMVEAKYGISGEAA